VLVVADTRGWAWGRKARAYAACLSDRFEIRVAYTQDEAVPEPSGFDLVHLFEVVQLDRVPDPRPYSPRSFRLVAGLTAHVHRTWGEERMHRWSSRVDALHGNSLLLVDELKPFHPLVSYLPNGVDAEVFRPPDIPRTGPVVFGHVGKPNPRKGGGLIIDAARRAGVTLLVNQRTSRVALDQDSMAAFYRGVDVEVTASNMDGTPNTMLEAASSGAALLSTPIGNMPEFVIDGENGFLLPELPGRREGRAPLPSESAEVAALSKSLVYWMTWFREHPVETREMGVIARRTVLSDWTWERQVRRVADMWTEVLG
jgi:glycosyltransferase involved in cell wall biosynthesis